jgi:glycerol-3-phosphate dehydrogenase
MGEAGPLHDLAIIGGGINGCGLARDAAGRGASVFLCEADDLGGGTSSASTKLIHGGLRYLEHFEFRLVRESLAEREILWRIAPHLVAPMRFVLPHHRGLRPAWLLRLGLLLYDHIGVRAALPASRGIDLARHAAGGALKPGLFARGFEYSDCRVDDARLVIANAQDAAERGATIAPRTRAVAARRIDGCWTLTVEDAETGARRDIAARILVNAAGPWVAHALDDAPARLRRPVRLVQGAHIVVRKLFDHAFAYLFQTGDGRVVFAIPYRDDFTLIGTTDGDFDGDPRAACAGEADIAYLCAAANAYFARRVTPADVVWSFAGVRPLADDGAGDAKSATRDYVFELDADGGGAPLLSIIGGKLTTYRRLAEAALEKLSPWLPRSGAPWTGDAPLPGGDFAHDGLADVVTDLRARFPFLARDHAARLVRAYGTRAPRVLGDAKALADLGAHFGATLTQAEVRYLIEHEWAKTAEDILWRRSKIGLSIDPAGVSALRAFMSGV